MLSPGHPMRGMGGSCGESSLEVDKRMLKVTENQVFLAREEVGVIGYLDYM